MRLVGNEELQGMHVRFPLQDPRFDPQADLPSLVVVQSTESGRQELARTGWWGSTEMNPKYVAVEASIDLLRAMRHRRVPSSPDCDESALVRVARGRDIAIHARGFWTPVWLAMLEAVAAVALAAAGILMTSAPFGIVAAVLGIVALAELAKTARRIKDAARRP